MLILYTQQRGEVYEMFVVSLCPGSKVTALWKWCEVECQTSALCSPEMLIYLSDLANLTYSERYKLLILLFYVVEVSLYKVLTWKGWKIYLKK